MQILMKYLINWEVGGGGKLSRRTKMWVEGASGGGSKVSKLSSRLVS